jgi:pentatricopeptide repeat protein
MPFVTASHRIAPDPTIPGDRCYVHYKRMVDAFKKERRWTTANNIYKEMIESRPYKSLDESVAEELAWQVFFIKYVMPYEDEKERENGTI